MVSSRLKIQYCKVIIITSLVWFLLDVFLLMYFTDCTMNSSSCDKGGGQPGDKDPRAVLTSKPGFLNRILPNATENDIKPKTKAKSKLDKVVERIKKQDEVLGKKGKGKEL